MAEHQQPGRDPGQEPGQEPGPEQQRGQAGETDWQRRRRLAEVFGEVLPETTRDERDPDVRRGRPAAGDNPGDRWLEEQVPPHHG